jgi:hypothetical protein
VLRALYAALLPARGACLVGATIRPDGDGAVLVCGKGDGIVALVSDGAYVAVEATPFHDGTSAVRAPRRRVLAIDPGGGAPSRATVAAAVLAHVLVVDHSASTLERALDVIMRLPTVVSAADAVVGARVADVRG